MSQYTASKLQQKHTDIEQSETYIKKKQERKVTER